MHLFSGDAPPAAEVDHGEPGALPTAGGASLAERVALLEAEVAGLRREIEALKSSS